MLLCHTLCPVPTHATPTVMEPRNNLVENREEFHSETEIARLRATKRWIPCLPVCWFSICAFFSFPQSDVVHLHRFHWQKSKSYKIYMQKISQFSVITFKTFFGTTTTHMEINDFIDYFRILWYGIVCKMNLWIYRSGETLVSLFFFFCETNERTNNGTVNTQFHETLTSVALQFKSSDIDQWKWSHSADFWCIEVQYHRILFYFRIIISTQSTLQLMQIDSHVVAWVVPFFVHFRWFNSI